MPIAKVLQNNREWASRMRQEKPDFFSSLADGQAPEYFWVGCADSRVPPNQILGLAPGDIFVQRNIGNLATHKDMNFMTCLEYAVDALKVKQIIVCGHYSCGAVKASLVLPGKTKSLANLWIADIKETRDKHAQELGKLSPDDQVIRLSELNVIRQVFNVCSSPIVQSAWDAGTPLTVHGLVYSLKDGLLKELTKPITGYGSLASEETKWEDQSLQKDITEQMKATMFFEKKDASAKK
ncbi:hypothetical protein ABBQ38_012044 [Trebouxia sp. C0009 RCD-2024]